MNVQDKQQGQGRAADIAGADERVQAPGIEGAEPTAQGEGGTETAPEKKPGTLKEWAQWYMERMTEASGYEADEITSRSRRRPLPAVRWMIGRELIQHEYPSTAIARELNIDHATLLHGRKMLEVMRESRRNWRLEIEIEEKFKQLIINNKQDDNGQETNRNEKE